MPNVILFQDVITRLASVKSRYLLLGNGFSISLKPNIFAYGSLFDNADFSAAPRVKQIFDSLDTKDFEVVIHHLEDAARVVEIYRPALKRLAEALRDDAAVVKDALVSVVAKRHPDRPYNIDDAAYMACRTFLSNFTNIFSLNYDVLLYWTMMHKDVDSRNLNYDDGFRHPEEDYGAPFVSWQEGQKATVHYLHGALHLFDSKSDIIKYTWSKTDIAIVDQIRSAMENDKYPIFVAEGTSTQGAQRSFTARTYISACVASKAAVTLPAAR